MLPSTIRQKILQQRKNLDSDFQNHASLLVMEKLGNMKEFQKAQNIALYLAINGELNTLPIIKKSWKLKKNCYLPICNCEDKTLSFSHYQQHDELIRNKYGIYEPNDNANNHIDIETLDLVITPLVAFDPRGNRLGMGCGFYDKTFALKKNHKKQKPYLLGVAYEFQKIQKITANTWDIPLDCVITEKEVYLFN